MRLLILPLLLASSLIAENVSFWQITKVQSNDTLNIRAEATYKSAKVTSIPYNAQCVKNYGCGKDINFEAMLNMQEDEVKSFLAQAKEDYCFIEYKGKSGWANKRYLKASTSPCK